MADLTVINVRTCQSNVYWQKEVTGSTGNKYNVIFDIKHSWSCNCPAYIYRRGECKHIKQVKNDKCNWNEDAIMGTDAEPNPDGTCPNCGGPTSVLKVGV